MPRPTGRGYALLALAVVTYLAGRLVGTWELYLLAFAFLAAVVLSWLSVLATGRRVRLTRTLTPDRPVAGDEPEIAFLRQECISLARAAAHAAESAGGTELRATSSWRSRASLPAARRC